MNQTLNEIADQILNAIYAGLKGPSNFSISRQQIKDEFSQARNKKIAELMSGNQFDPEPFRQTIHKIALTKKDFVFESGLSSTRKAHYAEIPELLHMKGIDPIGFVSVMDKTGIPFKKIYGSDIYYALRDRHSAKAPTIWVQDKSLWLLNPPIANIQFITFSGLLENPRALNGIAGNKFIDDDPYPIPGFVIEMIRKEMVYDYIKQYRLANPQPTLMAGDLTLNESGNKGGNK